MSESNKKSGLFVGLNHGFITTKPAKMAWKSRPVLRKGAATKRVGVVREVIREVAGFSPLEKKMLELIKAGNASKEKKSVKIARRKLGTHKRALAKRDEISKIIQEERRKQREKLGWSPCTH